MKPVRVRARAKLNLILKVGARRPDGYHEVETVMQALDFFDEVSLVPADATAVAFSWAPGLSGPLPEAPDLVHRSIELFAAATGGNRFRAEVVKRIPLGAGLGGGSADAAAALLGLSESQGRLLRAEDLFALAAEIGSDVPFVLQGGTAYAAGRGERIRALPAPKQFWWVLGFPEFPMSTPEVYERHDELARPLMDADLDGLKDALRSGEPLRLAGLLRNDLELAAFDIRPELGLLKEGVVAAGAFGAVLAGSGSAIAGLCRDEAHGREVAGRLADDFPRVEVVESATRGAELVD